MTQIFLVFFRMAQSLLNDFKVPFFNINSFLPASFLKRLLNQVGFLGDHTVAKNIQIQFGTQISFTVKVPNSYTFRSTFLVLFIYFMKHFVTVCKEKGNAFFTLCYFNVHLFHRRPPIEAFPRKSHQTIFATSSSPESNGR